MIKFSLKKAIAPVIAVTLLLVTAVLSAVFFQTWFQTFQSGLLIDVEQQGSISNLNIGIEALLDETLYFRSGDGTQISSVRIDGVECSGLNGTYSSGIQPLNVSDCLSSVTSSTPNIVVVTNSGVLSKIVFIEENSGVGSGGGSQPLSTSLSCNTDFDGNLYISAFCANYPMNITTLEGHLDPDDSNALVVPRVECVWNSNRSACESYFAVDGCGTDTVLDTSTGLCWDRNFNRNGSVMNWTNAIAYCDELIHAGHSDWYLPSRQEFETIVDLSRTTAPHIVGGNNNIFQNVVNGWYWTKTTYGPSTSLAFDVYLITGDSSLGDKTNGGYVACVRRN